MNRRFIAKELMENRWVLLAMLLIAGFMGFTFPLVYKEMFQLMMSTGVTYEKYLWYDWFSRAQLQILLIGCIIMGSTSIARETSKGTAGLLISLPVSRSGILANKIITGIFSILILILVNSLIPVLTSGIFGIETIKCRVFIVGMLADFILLVPVYLLSVMFSAMFSSSMKAGMTTVAFVLAAYVPAWFGLEYSMVTWLTGVFGYLAPACIIILAALSAVFIYITTLVFNKKEFWKG